MCRDSERNVRTQNKTNRNLFKLNGTKRKQPTNNETHTITTDSGHTYQHIGQYKQTNKINKHKN